MNPNYVAGQEQLTWYLAWSERRDEAFAALQKMADLDLASRNRTTVESGIYYHQRDYRGVVEATRRFTAMNPNDWTGHYFLGVTEEALITRGTVVVVHPVVTLFPAAQTTCLLTRGASLLAGVVQGRGQAPPDQQKIPCWTKLADLPHIPAIGDRDAPFDPLDDVTKPGGPWRCDPNNECEAPCPPGSARDHQKLREDPGAYGEPHHWDWTDCNGHTWKIWDDGTMSPA